MRRLEFGNVEAILNIDGLTDGSILLLLTVMISHYLTFVEKVNASQISTYVQDYKW